MIAFKISFLILISFAVVSVDPTPLSMTGDVGKF